MSTPEVGAAVVGAGMAGLAAALELQRSVPDLVVIDPSDRPGGVMRTDHVAGYVVERGPNTVQLKAPMVDFLRRLGLEGTMLRARAPNRLRFVFYDGQLVPVPMSPLGFVRTPLLSARGKLRVCVEPFVGRGDGASESVAEFARRRLGDEVVSNLIGPFLTGRYAGDEEHLGADAVFGSLVELEREHRSLALGLIVRALRRQNKGGLPGSWSAPEGLGPFARRLAEQLAEPPALGSRVVSIARDGRLWRIEISGPGGERVLRAARVVLASSAPDAAKLLRGVCNAAARALAEIEYAPIVGIPLGADPAEVRTKIEGFGYLVPREADIALLGCLFMSQLFPGRAPAGRELLHCMFGGVRWRDAIELPDQDLVKRAMQDLDHTLGLSAEPQTLGVTRWPHAIAQPDRRHVARIEGVRAQLRSDCPGLLLAGAYLDGVSVADTLASGVRAANELAAAG
jgi:oxygen-dependent protoporphyrinogen oxidase